MSTSGETAACPRGKERPGTHFAFQAFGAGNPGLRQSQRGALWWALSLGACLGGNGTLIGASANVVLSDISKKFGHEITFMQFFKRGFPIMLFTVAIAAIYMVIRFPGG